MLIHNRPPRRQQAEEESPSLRGRLPRFGVALFDESRDSGWACLVDQQPFRFRQPQDLPNSCIWVCSLGTMDMRQRWGSLHHLRSADYVSKLHFLAQDYGLRVEGEGKFGQLAQKACLQLAPTIHRTMVIASQVYGWSEPSSMLRKDSLSEDLRASLVEPPVVRNHMRGATAAAYQGYSSPTWGGYRGEADSISINLRYNRLDYAIRLLSQDMPDSAWQRRGDEGGRDHFPLKEFLDPSVPCIVNATIDFVGKDQELASLCAFGSEPNRRGALRQWIAQPELMWLSQFANVHVTAAYIAECAKPLPYNAQLPEMMVSDPFWSLSIPAGLVAEAHWKALASPIYNPKAAGDKKDYNSWSVWLRAWDRAYSFQLALAAHKAGFFVSGYGNGSVLVRCPRARLPHLLDFAEENGIAHPSFQSIFADHGLLQVQE
jgi:hypothetical protein